MDIDNISGTTMNRPELIRLLGDAETALEQLNTGASISAVAREFGTSRQIIIRLCDDAVRPELEEQRGADRTTPAQSPEGMAIPSPLY